MKSYLLGAAGVIFLSVIVSLLVPEGKLNKTITFIMRLICIVVLIQPLTGIFTGKTDGTVAEDVADYTFVSEVYSDHQSEQLEKLLLSEFGLTADCTVTVTYSDGDFKVTEAEVKLSENNGQIIETIYEYLRQLGYINITVYAEST